jgi:predicted ATP-dependent serine protease
MKNWILFFNQLALSSVLKKEFWMNLINFNMGPEHWVECDAKNLMLEFQEQSKKSLDLAQHKMFPRVSKLEGMDLPESTAALQGMFSENLEYARFEILAKDILRNPANGKILLENFKNNKSSELKSFHFQKIMEEVIRTNEKNAAEGKSIVTIPGWEKLSYMIRGFNPGRVIILTAGTGIGKTTWSLNFALAASKKFTVDYFNMEMPIQDIAARAIMAGSKTSHKDWYSGKFDPRPIAAFYSKLIDQSPIYFTDGSALSLEQISGRIFSQKKTDGLGLAIVDYDQKIRTRYSGEEWQNLHRAVEHFEEVAKACEIPIIMLSQADDNGDPKASKRIKQVASSVLNFYEEGGVYKIRAIKNRFGRINDEVILDFNIETMTIKEASGERPSYKTRNSF